MPAKTQIFGDQIVNGTITNAQISASATISSSKITPPGSTLQLSYNNAGVFAGTANITTDGTNLTLATGTLNANILKGASSGLILRPFTDGTTALRMQNAAGTQTALTWNDNTNYVWTFDSPSGIDNQVIIQGGGIGGGTGNLIVRNNVSAAAANITLTNDTSNSQVGASLNLTTNAVGGFSRQGGSVTLTSGGTFQNSTNNGAGGNLTLTSAGTSTSSTVTGAGGTLTITSGSATAASGITTGASGGILISTGSIPNDGSSGGSGISGGLTITTGASISTISGASGSILITTGQANGSGPSFAQGTGNGGGITLSSGNANSPNVSTGSGGSIVLTSGSQGSGVGSGSSSGAGGSITLMSGNASGVANPGAGGSLTLTTGAGGSNGALGGNVILTAGNPVNGGNISLTGTGASNGKITAGGNMAIDGTTFNVDSVNHRVGILTSSPTVALQIDSNGTATGGSFTMTTAAIANAVGGTLTLTSGNSTAGGTTQTGGSLVLTSGSATGAAPNINQGGSITLLAAGVVNAGGVRASRGGSVTLSSGGTTTSSSELTGGNLLLKSGDAPFGTGSTLTGGSLTLSTGDQTGTGANQGGSITLTSGNSAGTNAGGNVTLTSFTPANGGNLILTGTGTHGFINLANTIDWTGTSAPALSASGHGRIYFDSGSNSFKQSSNGGAYTPLGAVTSIIGTANQVIASSPTGDVTLSLPQSIALTSSPTFQNLSLGSVTPGGLILKDTQGSPSTVTIEAPTTISASYVLRMPTAQGGANTAIINDGSGNLSWGTAGTGSVTQNTYTVGTASGTYTGSTTLFNLPFTYTQDGRSLQVMYNGQVLVSGVDYSETSNTSVTFTSALTAGYTAVFRYITPQTPSNTSVAQYANFVIGTPSGTYTGSTTVYNLPFAYTQDAKSLEVFYDGVQLVPGDDYTETTSTSITTTMALVTSQKIAFRTISTIGNAAAVTALRENYIVGTPSGNYTGSTTVFDLINTYTPGGINLQVYLDGDLQTVGAGVDYVETDNNTVTFNFALTAGQKVTFLFSQTVAATGTVTTGSANTIAAYNSAGSTIASINANTSAGGFKITNAANGTAASDVATFGQVPVFTQWTAFTPIFSNFGTVTTQQFYWRQEADEIKVRGTFTAGTLGAGVAAISWPTAPNFSKMPNITTRTTMVGTMKRLVGSFTPEIIVFISTDGTTNSVNLSIAASANVFLYAVGTDLGANTNTFTIEYSFAI